MARNFVHGTTTLAVNMSTAMSQDPERQNSKTPSRIVLSASLPKSRVYMTGKILAGRYKTSAASRNAHVRLTESGLRARTSDPHRAHGIEAPTSTEAPA